MVFLVQIILNETKLRETVKKGKKDKIEITILNQVHEK